MQIIKGAYNNTDHIWGYPIPAHTQAWYDFRNTQGWGASEIGDLLAKSPPKYRKILPVMLEEKAGMRTPERKMNEQMLSGLLAEPLILERWKFFDGDPYNYIQNMLGGNVIREFRKVEMYLVNQKFPWLFCSLDASSLAGQSSLRGKKETGEHPIECKQLSYFASQTWEHKIPAQYIYQIHQQMLITETDYCELAVLQDGYNFKVYPFELNLDIAKEILEVSREKWEMVLQLRKKKEEMDHYRANNRYAKAEDIKAEIDSMLPLPDESEGWKDFLAERYINETEQFTGSLKDFRSVLKLLKYESAIDVIENEIALIKNQHRARFVAEQAEYMDFNASGRVRFYKRKVKGGGLSDPILDYRGIKTRTALDDVKELIEPLFK